MACGGCVKRRAVRAAHRRSKEDYDLMGGYANLTSGQINARLEIYKRRYCKQCDNRYDCDYGSYVSCRKDANIK